MRYLKENEKEIKNNEDMEIHEFTKLLCELLCPNTDFIDMMEMKE